ncbi:MAG TPA: tail fiber domain-containing protein, partial [Candidatus Woesebacteria bacterium]|nr:tail fiber domain-containing protein [Candidatus Woesebacteria bacterium]
LSGAGTKTVTNSYGLNIGGFGGSGVTNAYGLYIADQTGASTSNYAIYSAGGTNYFAGNVGIGTTSPGSNLHILGNSGITIESSTAYGPALNILGSTQFRIISSTATDTEGADKLIFRSGAGGGVSKMVLTSGGNVGIGTTSPSALLHGIKTTEQLRLGYDASNYFSTTVSSTGAVTLDAVGSGAAFTMSDTLNVPSLYFSSSQAYLTYEDIDTLGFQGNLSVSDDLSILGATVLSATSSLSKPSGTGILSFSTSTATSGITLANTGSTTTGNSGISLSSNATTGTGVGITANSITSGTGLGVSTTSMNTGSLVSFSAAGTNGQTGHKVLNVSNNGTNIAGNQLTYGAYVTNTRSGGSAYNVAGYFSASGGALNYAALFDGGNVGIGTTAPGSKLEVTGDIKITNGTNRLILASNSSAPTGTAGAMYYDSSNNKFKCYTTSWVDCDTIGSGTLPSGSDGDTLYYETETGGWSSTNNLFNNGTNIGIGTTSPGSKLQVTGDIKLTDGANRLILASNASDPSGTAGAMYYNSTTKRFRCYQDGAWIDCIGYNPQRDVVIVDEFVGGTTSSANIGDLGWTLSAGTVAAVTPTGSNIGTIRLSTPATANGRGVLWLATGAGFVSLGNNGDIHITGKFAGVTSNANLTHYFGLIVSNANGNPANALMFRASGTGNWNAVNRASSSETGTVTDCSVAQSTTFRTFEIIVNSDATSVVYKIDGTTCATYTTNIPTSAVTLSPMFKVDTVDATARTVMDIDRFVLTRGQLRGADLAEFYYTQDPSINAGDIVSTSPQGATMVNKASTQNRQALLGVVSTKPGEVLGSSMGPGMPVMVGLAGRVPVKVTSENGPISVGDPITISSVPGVGMKATRAGAIVGRALEAYVNPDPTAIGNVMLFLSLEHYVPTLTPEQFGELVLRESAPQQFSIESLMGGRTLGREAFEAFDGLMVGRMQAGVTETQILRVGQSAQIAGIFAQQDGKVGIGTSAPTHTFEVKAKEKDIARFEAMDSTGCTLSAGGIISCSSDSALKKDVTDVVSGLDTLMQLRPVSFHWNSQGEEDEKYLGFIAQEVEEVLPELVTTDITGYKQLNSIGLIPVVAKAVQEQQGLILSLQQEVQASVPDTKIATLDEGIHTLTQKVGFWDGVLISFQSIIQSIQDTIASIQNQMLFTQDDIMLTRHQVNALAETVTDITAWKEAITSGAVVLGASHSALLTTPEATISALTITDSLQVDGSTTVFDLTVLNKLTTGVIELGAGIDGDEINSATGIRFQTLAQAPIDFMNGKVVIDVDGSIKASQLKIDTASELSSAAGKALMEAGELLVTVPTTRVSAESLVLLTVEGDYAPATRYWVTDVTDGESFTVRFDRPSIAPVTIHWMLVN